LAIAAAKRPELLIFDEPAAALDPLARKGFTHSLVEFVNELGASAVLSLRGRIEGEHSVPCRFRLKYLEPYAEAARTWLHGEAEVVDTTHLTPAQAALQNAQAVTN
jgi:ABC-type arginine transport system ATPase subunit